MPALLPLLELFDLLLHRVIGELGEEHFFLLVHELVNILSALLLWELHTAAGDVHGLMDHILLLHCKVLFLGVVIAG